MDLQPNAIIYDFTTDPNYEAWQIVNDGVMGGLSKGKVSFNAAGNVLFEGFIVKLILNILK